MKYKIINFLYEIFKTRIANYLHKNNLKLSNIKSKQITKINNHLYFRVNLDNGLTCDFRFFPYKLNTFGALFLASTTTVTTTGMFAIFGNYKFKEKDNEIALEPISEVTITEKTEDPVETIIYEQESVISSPDAAEVSYTPNEEEASEIFEFVDPTELDPLNELDIADFKEVVESSNQNYRDIVIPGSYDPCYDSYQYILDRYSEPINKYGNRYGIDPSIIAALIMEEVGTQDYESYQTNYACLGLGQVNCNYFEDEVFHTYNFDAGTYEDYRFKYEYLKNDRDEQIKAIAIFLQFYANRYNGNLYLMFVAYNQGMTSADNIVKNAMNDLGYSDKEDIYNIKDVSILQNYNPYKYGDPEYYQKLVTFLNFILKNEVFNSDTAKVILPEDENSIEYRVSLTEVESLKGASDFTL